LDAFSLKISGARKRMKRVGDKMSPCHTPARIGMLSVRLKGVSTLQKMSLCTAIRLFTKVSSKLLAFKIAERAQCCTLSKTLQKSTEIT
jgi:hypothetical protein